MMRVISVKGVRGKQRGGIFFAQPGGGGEEGKENPNKITNGSSSSGAVED